MPNAYDKFFKGQWTANKDWDPLTHRAIELTVKQDSHNIAAIDHGISKAFGGDGSTVLGDEARKVENDPARGVGRAALVAGGIVGAMWAAPAAGGSAGGGAAAGGGGAGSAGAAGATNPALIESYLGTSGYGASSAGAGGGAGGAAAGTNGWSRYGNAMQQGGNAMQQQQNQDEVPQDPVVLPSEGRRPYWEMATSSRKAKRPETRARMGQQAAQDGASGADPISRNGLEIGAIQALTKRLAEAKKTLAELEAQ